MILKPFELFYHLVTSAKNHLYDLQILKTQKLNVPVISIGNLSFGGTGKTPWIEFLAQAFADRKVVIVCRSYKAELKKPARVDLSHPLAAKVYGDEAVLLQRNLPHCSVWSGPDKTASARAAIAADRPQLIIVDDGFSHRKLHRDFNLVLVDAACFQKEYHREALGSLIRADAVVFSKIEQATAGQRQRTKEVVLANNPRLNTSVYESGTKIQLQLNKSQKLFAFCGIAKAQSFREALVQDGFTVSHFESYADHQPYPANLQMQILQRYQEIQKHESSLKIVTTEKDFMKLNLPALVSAVTVVSYRIEMQNQQKENLFEKIRARTQS